MRQCVQVLTCGVTQCGMTGNELVSRAAKVGGHISVKSMTLSRFRLYGHVCIQNRPVV